ncbi:hypothetical protein ACRZOU_004410 [Aeromonas salmonicida]
MWATVKEWFVWALDMWPVLKEVLPTLGWGGVLIVLIQCFKGDDLNVRRFWSKVQILVLGCTLLLMLWHGYWMLHPSKQEVQWQQGTNQYGLY